MKKKKIKKIKMKKILKGIQENYAWIFGSITLSIPLVSSIFKFFEYLRNYIYFGYYGIDMSLYNMSENSLFYYIGNSIFIMFLFSISAFCLTEKNINKGKKIIRIIIAGFYNFMIVFYLNFPYLKNINIPTYFVIILILLSIESFCGNLAFNKKINDKDSGNPFINIIFLIGCIIVTILISEKCTLKNQTEYRIINNEKVIIYSTKDYLVTVDCNLENDEIIIFKGTQEKINNDNVYSKLINVKKSKIK